ncbi:COMM domain-containing protein 2-like [Galleria mellonella]|uniref:COMM domain-containing protein 2-like n=1 Tax=Galleria mellonella TaxID=7137 RepID=A0A6J1X4U4_GALME|nr:COMM domain-containing protein 2-like [Galleria mellonella]XP_026764375.1 COMM domain-containing protein 2-like [Galleria mellonella]
MIIFLSELQKEHLDLLHKHSIQVLIDFCKLTIDYLNNGVNPKKHNIAAEKLNVPMTVVQNLVHALVYLIIEACKHNLSESDFKSSLALAGFSTEQQEILVKLYNTKKTELSSALNLLQQKDPTYQDLSWRFEVQIASRNSSEEIKPMVSMDFVVMTPKNFRQPSEDKIDQYSKNNNKNVSPIHINSTVQEAKAASHCQNIINHHLLQCDLPNLIHMTNVLDQALKESKSQHVRKVQRAL